MQSAPNPYSLGASQHQASRLTQTCVQRTGCGTRITIFPAPFDSVEPCRIAERPRRSIELRRKLSYTRALCDRIRPRARGLFEKIVKAASQRILIKITRAHHVEARSLQGLRDQASIIGCGVEGTRLISGVADYERNPIFSVCRSGRNQRAKQQEQP